MTATPAPDEAGMTNYAQGGPVGDGGGFWLDGCTPRYIEHTATPAPALTDRTGASDEEFAARIAPFGIFEPEEREAAVVESVARALWDVDNPHYPAVFTKAQADELWAGSRGHPMHTTYVTRAVAAVAAYRAVDPS